MSQGRDVIGISMRSKAVSAVLALALVGLLLVGAGSASAAVSFCTLGTGPGQCDQPGGVAVDRSNGRVYVADSENDRINVFQEDGTFISSFGSTGSGLGQLSRPWAIAVDNDPTSPAFHDVYVADNNKRVQRFTSSGTPVLTFGEVQLKGSARLAVGSGGAVYVGESQQVGSETVGRIWKFSPSGVLTGTSTLPGNASIGDLAVDSSEDAYVLTPNNVRKFELSEPTATLLFSVGADNARVLTVGQDDSLYVAEQDHGFRVITKSDASGQILKRFGYGQIQFNFNGLGIGTESLFGSEENVNSETIGNKVVRIDQLGPGPLACCLTAVPSNTKATLKGQINPEGKSTTYTFDYITESDYVANGNSFEGANPAISTPEAAIGAGASLESVEAQLGCVKVEVPAQPSCLKPATPYRYRLVAVNAEGEAEVEGTFTTLPPLQVEEVFATDVGIDSGRLHAVVNPLSIPATGYFEYIDDATYQADMAQGGGHDGFAGATKVPNVDAGKAPIGLGEGETGKEVARELTSLPANTLFHYRFVASNPFLTVPSDENVMTTYPTPASPDLLCPNEVFRTAASAALPECRAYEMVSPVEKNGTDIKVLLADENYPSRLDQGSDDGNRFTYSSSSAFGDAESAPWSSQYLATRKEGQGWSSRSLNPPRASVPLTDQYIVKLNTQYKLFNSELSTGWLSHETEPPLDECAPAGFINLYRRNLISGEYESLVTVEPMNTKPLVGYRLEVQGVSSDETRTVFRANAKLTDDASNVTHENAYQIYEHIADEGCGELRLVNYLPNGKVSSPDASVGLGQQPGGNLNNTVLRAVSSDASRVVFSLFGGSLFVRINADQQQSAVSGGKCTEPGRGCTLAISSAGIFRTASIDGSKVVYATGKGLYEFDVGKAIAGESASTLIAEGNPGAPFVAAANDDLSRLYFVSTNSLGGEGEDGKPNLYLRENGTIRLVATLRDLENGGDSLLGVQVGSPRLSANGVRSTADGRYLAFVTTSSPTGYDNADAVDGRPNLEVHLYDADTNKVACISCNPSGSRPRGRAFFKGPQYIRVSAFMAPAETQTFAPRALSADGNRLFFESFEALLPRDTNGKADVYEWQRASGEKDCKEVGTELYVPAAEGCLSLISSGKSPVDSEFADASPNGHDVFIRTASSLLPQDDGLVDIYDARINGGFPQPLAPPAACEGEACQGPLNAPDDPTPASSAFEGAGNVTAEDKPASCRKPKVKRKGRCVAKKTRKAKAHKSTKAHKKQRRSAN